MKTKQILALAVAAGLMIAQTAVAKEIKIGANNTPYSEADVQKLAATAAGMGVKEPVNLDQGSDGVTVSGSSATKCTFKVGSAGALQIQGVSCK